MNSLDTSHHSYPLSITKNRDKTPTIVPYQIVYVGALRFIYLRTQRRQILKLENASQDCFNLFFIAENLPTMMSTSWSISIATIAN